MPSPAINMVAAVYWGGGELQGASHSKWGLQVPSQDPHSVYHPFYRKVTKRTPLVSPFVET